MMTQTRSLALPGQRNLQTRLTLYALLAALVPTILIGLLAYTAARNQLIQQTTTTTAQVITTVGDSLSNYLFERRGDAQVIAQSETLRSGTDSPEDIQEFLQSYLEIYGAYVSIYYLDTSGNIIVGSNDAGGNLAGQPWFTPALTTSSYLTDVYYLTLDQRIVITATAPVYSQQSGQLIGLIAANVDARLLFQLLEAAESTEGGEVEFVNTEGRVVLDQHIDRIFEDVSEAPSVQAALAGESGSNTVETDETGQAALSIYAPVGNEQGWVGIVRLPLSVLDAPANTLAAQMAAAGLLVTLLTMVLVSFAARQIVQPIRTLTSAAERLAAGDFATPITVQSADEIGTLANAFQAMSAQIQDFINSLEARVQARTRDLATTVEVGRLATSIYNQDEMLPQLVEFIRAKFDIYYAQIYLLDDAKRFAVLRAGSGNVGRELMARRHRLDMLETSLVSTAVGSGQPIVVPDTALNPNHKPNPLLPRTRSEVAVPLIVGQDILGVLDMQAVAPDTFNNDNAPVFQAMANQIASSLRAAEAFDEAQIAVHRSEEVNRRLTANNWGEYLETLNQRGRVGYEYDLESPEWLDTGKMEAIQDPNAVMPIMLGGQEIGRIVVKDPEQSGYFTDDDRALVADVSNRLSQALEQYRAFDQVQRARKDAEQLSFINAALSQADSPDRILAAVAPLLEQYGVMISSVSYVDQDEDGRILQAVTAGLRAGDGQSLPLSILPTTINTPETLPMLRLVEQYPDHPMVIGDMRTDPRVDETTRAFSQMIGVEATLTLPLRAAHGWSGFLSFNWGAPQQFDPALIDLLTAIMPTAAAVFEASRQAIETARRAEELETVAQVSAATTTLLELQELLGAVVDLTKERFDLYHAHIYLLDESGEYLNLAAGAGEPGRLMLEHGHRIPYNKANSLVARAARERRGILANDVTAEPDFLPNPLLPETRAELSQPLVVGDRLLGVLDMQSTQVGYFTEQDVRLKAALADQIAVAIQNALAFREQQEIAERLREVDKLKSQFLANMSHELRTPLNSIIGYAEVLMDGIDGDLTEEAVEDVQAIHNGGKHLLTIINDILDLAKIEAGQMYMNRGQAKLEPVLNEVMNNLSILAKNRNLELNLVMEPGLPAVLGDPIRLKQIAYNLVNNAIKFTEQGSVSVHVALINPERVEVRIVDTGIGMTEQDIAGLFQQFHQVDGSPTRRAGGTGLGLVITRHLVEMHDGQIIVESEKGVGSVFRFSLPVFAVPEAEAA
jgi:signal transduction histidine kinase/HAMP domain-containing protein